jgi:hypothetical protein
MQDLIRAVEKNRQLILDTERYVWKNPETGYKEYKTSKYMAEQFIKLGYDLTYAESITGFFTTIDTGREGPTVLVLGELDSIICRNHPDSDPETGAVHSCAHHVQCASLLGVAKALQDKETLEGLCGKIKLCFVPAEEGIQISRRKELINNGIITFASGKAEMFEVNILRSPDRQEVTSIRFHHFGGCRVNDSVPDGMDNFGKANVESIISIDSSYSSILPDTLSRMPENAPFFIPADENLNMKIFIDRSIVEVFVNGRQCAAIRVYPGREDSTGISFSARGGSATVKKCVFHKMENIWDK